MRKLQMLNIGHRELWFDAPPTPAQLPAKTEGPARLLPNHRNKSKQQWRVLEAFDHGDELDYDDSTPEGKAAVDKLVSYGLALDVTPPAVTSPTPTPTPTPAPAAVVQPTPTSTAVKA